MASSFSQSWTYDVFLSYRGDDTRHNFVDHLYRALMVEEIHTFKDDESLLPGESIGPSLLKAIQESQVVVVVFSKKYLSSSWCLDELAAIMEGWKERWLPVFPIFYDMDPSYLGEFEKVFGRKQSKDKSKVELWKRAILYSADCRDCEPILVAQGGNEVKAIGEIVSKILRVLDASRELTEIQGGPKIIEEIKNLQIPLQVILSATNKFAEENIIARGGFGNVYQVQSEQHGTVAVKRLNPGRGQGHHEFMMEITLLSAYTHENLVSLVGFCDENGEKILVYKHESNGSLDKHLHSKGLTWMQRLKICLDAARGLEYLHNGVGPQHRVLHRDVKSSNILLDENWKAKISDFGLSKIGPANVRCTFLFSNACGTIGYIDPQYREENILTQKSDVFSFGVVLFEVLCARPAWVPEYHDERQFLFKLAQNHYQKRTLDVIINNDLRKQMDSASLRMFSTIAYQCLRNDGKDRPTMSEVVKELQKALVYQQDFPLSRTT